MWNRYQGEHFDPNNALAHNNLGFVYEKLALPAEALAQYQSALQLQPGDALAPKNLARLQEGRR